MVGVRISKGRYANPPASAFDGEGSRRRGGRWTRPGLRVAYASASLALAQLEYFVNLSPQDAPDGLVSIIVEIPEGLPIEEIDKSVLPPAWYRVPFPEELWAFGDRWVASARSVCLRVPSAVSQEDFNLLINPAHPDFKYLIFSQPRPFEFDRRMWKGTTIVR